MSDSPPIDESKIVIRIALPVSVSALDAIVDGLTAKFGEELFMREEPKGILNIFKP